MTEKQLTDWTVAYRKRFLGPGENFDFVTTWDTVLLGLDFADALAAIEAVALDPRDAANFPRQHLRLLVEHANARRDERERAARKIKPWGNRPKTSESWDRRMLEIGTIDEKEFKRRQAERKKVKS
jgi:hypothetical protein